jgi:polysaccharide biosynthesis transport protein
MSENVFNEGGAQDQFLRPSPMRASRPAARNTGTNGSDDREVHLLDYVKVLYKRRRIAATAFLLAVLGAVIYTFTATPVFQARTQLLIEADNQNVVSFKEVVEQEKATNDYYLTQYQILQSRSLARRALDRLKMWDLFDPAKTSEAGFSVRGFVRESVSYFAQLVKPAKPAEPHGADETEAQSKTLDKFLEGLTISPIRDSRLVDVKYDSPNPRLAAAVANALANSYIEQSLEFKYTASREASDWLGQRLGEQRKQVESTEAALQRYREQNDALSLEERQNIVVQKLADLNSAVTKAKTERLLKEAAYNQIVGMQHDRQLIDTMPAVLSNQFVQQQKNELADLQRQQTQLSEKLGPNHPDMVKLRLAIQSAEARIQNEIVKIVQSMKNDYQASAVQEQSLVRALEQQKQDAQALNRKGIDYGVLQRDASSNRQIFDALMQRTKETGISGELKTSNIRIVDAAEVPRKPASPNVAANLALGFVGGAVLAIGLAFFFEYADNRIKSPAEIKAHLGLAVLGMVPREAQEAGAAEPLLTNPVKATFAEAMRGVRTNVLFSSLAAEGTRSLVITSTGPGEGKTLVASNLALALAQTGQRVILIDADMRRPRVNQVFGLPQEPGLSNVLVGEAKASAAVRQTASSNLWVLPAGHIPPNPAELLGSQRFEDFVKTLGEHFAWVIIDSPPVMAVTDAPIIAHRAGGVVFVVGAEMTSRHLAQTAIEQLTNADAHVIGAVLNGVDLEHNAYYYSQYYRREYGEYYTNTA